LSHFAFKLSFTVQQGKAVTTKLQAFSIHFATYPKAPTTQRLTLDLCSKIFYVEPSTIAEEVKMPTAFVLINTEIGSEADVLKDLKKVEGVAQAFAVYGVYDIVATVKADTMEKLKEIVTWRVRRLDKVRSTLTMIVVEESK
jgi:DNA-binding Lrp family transcriptional regulator